MDSPSTETKPLNAIERLLVLQDRDRKLTQLSRERDEIPARKKLIEQRLAEYRAALEREQEELKKKLSATKQVDIEVESSKTRILKLREQQGQVKTNEQYRAIEGEVSNIQSQIRALEDQEIELMEQAEVIKTRVADATRQLQHEESIVKSDWAAQDERLKSISTELEALKKDRDSFAAGVDPDWLSRYERVFKHWGDLALAPIERGTCGGCHMNIEPQRVQDAKRAASIVNCSYCGRILYWSP